ncbi:MAG: WG repeat-containing protein [Cyclobacteriaceae bacterium]|nr:WG repeat-containing protein [Cyclobacteriaceae bacterium]
MAQTNETVHIYQENKLWGLMANNPITPAVYDTLIPVLNTNLFIAKKHRTSTGINSTGVITNKGKSIIPFSYLQITPSSKSFIVNKWEHNELVFGVLNQSNKVVLNVRFKEINSFYNYWVTKSASGELHLYDREGNFMTKVEADSVSISENHKSLLIHKNGKTGVFDPTGKENYLAKFRQIDYKNGSWETSLFPEWQIISTKDTIKIQADSIKIWDANYFIIGVHSNYYISHRDRKVSNTYESIQAVSSNFAIIQKASRYGVVNRAGEEIMAPSFGQMHYAKGYFYTKSNNQWSVYDSTGTKRSIFKYDSIGSVSNGLFPIKRKGKWGFMNRNGKEVVHCIYDYAANFKQGKAIIQYFGASGIVDLKGDWIVKPKDGLITDYSFNFYILKKGSVYYLKNYENQLIYFTSNQLVFKNETIYEIKDGYTNKVSSLGTLVENGANLENGNQTWQIIKIGNKYGFENTQGLLKITYRYDSLLQFSEGLAAFKLRGKWGFINKNEEIVIQPLFNKVTSFKNNRAIITLSGMKGIVKLDGSFVLTPKFESIKPIETGLWLVKENGLWGIYDSNGKIIIQPKFDQVKYIHKDLIIVIRNGMYGVMNFKGISLFPRIYDFIGYNAALRILLLKQIM